MTKIPQGIKIRMLTENIRGSFRTVAKSFITNPKNNFEVRQTHKLFHDRVIFVDDVCYVTGLSIKDAAKKKPTYLDRFTGAKALEMKNNYEDLWLKGSIVSL